MLAILQVMMCQPEGAVHELGHVHAACTQLQLASAAGTADSMTASAFLPPHLPCIAQLHNQV